MHFVAVTFSCLALLSAGRAPLPVGPPPEFGFGDLQEQAQILVGGTPDWPTPFPQGASLDQVSRDARGRLTLRLTLPDGYTATDRVSTGETDAMMEALAWFAEARPEITSARILARDDARAGHRPLSALFPRPEPVPTKPYETALEPGAQAGAASGPRGGLAGKSIFLNPGHGWYDNDGIWRTQRGNSNGLVEDFSNAEPVLQYLVPYFEKAGASVYTMRERDMNRQMRVVDNDRGAFQSTGTWRRVDEARGSFGGDHRIAAVSPEGGATATFEAQIETDGFYHVYIWYGGDADATRAAEITIRHADGVTLRTQDQQRDGFTWKDLGRFYFRAGDPKKRRSVVISNRGEDSSSYVIADAVRFGGGVDEAAFKPRWEMSGLYYAPFMGCDECATGTVSTMPRLTKWENEAWEDGVYLSWHTNAPNPGRGTSAYAYASGGYDTPFNGVPGSVELRDAVYNEIVGDIRAGWDSDWSGRGTHTNWYGEINPNYNDETPGAIFEVAFHATPADAEELKEPDFRRLVARAVYQGTTRYFAQRDRVEPHFLPEPPTGFSLRFNDGTPQLAWQAPVADGGGIAGDPAVGYRIYGGVSGKGFQDPVETLETQVTVHRASAPAAAKTYYARVAAVNRGGESFATETLSLSLGPGPRVLIVNGFDRLDRHANVPEAYYGGGPIERGYLDRMNSFDYVGVHGRALRAAGLHFDSASNEAVAAGTVRLDRYPVVVWILGEESVWDRAFDTTEQALLAEYLDQGGALLVSGSEIGWDLWEYGSDADRAFYRDYLFARYLADTSDSGTVEGRGIFAGIGPFDFDYEDYQIYAANWPECIEALPGATDEMVYPGTGCAAAVAADNGVYRVIYMGFPFETIYDSRTRHAIMARAMAFLGAKK